MNGSRITNPSARMTQVRFRMWTSTVTRLGHPIAGHLTVASFASWGRAIQRRGFDSVRQHGTQPAQELARLGLTKYWDLYVFRRPDVLEPILGRDPSVIDVVLRRFGLADRVAAPDDADAVAQALHAEPPA
jgi:hypothetical protein